jgi:competence protein ComEA
MERPHPRSFRAAWSQWVTRVIGSRFAKPIARVALAAAGIAFLAFIGRTAVAGALSASSSDRSAIGPALAAPSPPPAAGASAASSPPRERHDAIPPESSPISGPPPVGQSPVPGAEVAARLPASASDPVVLNTATESDLRRLPGIGAKRAGAILALRVHLGRFRAIEDLLRVKGIGRATLKRLRPLVRLDSPSDGGLPSPAGPLSEPAA